MNEQLRYQAQGALASQRHRFEHEASHYMSEAKDITQAEVA